MLAGKIALITGGDSDIGLATAKEFVHEGAHVFITGSRDLELAAAVKEIGGNVTGVQVELSNLGDLDRLFSQIRREEGRLDVVFTNVVVAKGDLCGQITEEYDPVFNTVLKALFFTVQKALRLVSNGGSIVLHACIVAEKTETSGIDSATRAAVSSLVHTWAADLKPRSIRVNAVPVGRFATLDEVARAVLFLASDSSRVTGTDLFMANDSNHVSLGSVATPDQIAEAVVFLASDESSSITGTELLAGNDVRRQVASLNPRKKKRYEN